MSNSSSRRRSPNRRGREPAPVKIELTVERLGAGGDGVGQWRGAPVYAPGLLAGERAAVQLGAKRGDGRQAAVVALLDAAAERIEPPCPYAADCGGCTVQHLADEPYILWKESLLDQPLASRGLIPEIRRPMLRIADGRRRIRLAAIGRADGAVIGLNAKASKQIVDLDRCMAATEGVADAPALLRPLMDRILKSGEAADIEVRAAKAGLDVLIVRKRPFDMAEREAIASFAAASGLARLAWRPDDRDSPEVVAERASPAIDLGGLTVTPPPGAFFQPTAAGEAAMADFAARHLAGVDRVADLYCGWGAFALRLAGPMHVEAFESDAAMVAALNRAASPEGKGVFVQGIVRDLARQPLMAADLKRFGGLILDPPRGGAAFQVEHLAIAGPAKVVYLSCNPASLARDARMLVDGGYRFVEAQPIDQFRWTPHLEVACYFERAA